MKVVMYEDEYLFYVWKPAGIPSTFWNEKSFLEMLMEENQLFVETLKKNFSEEEEYWLLNRLDTPTSWLLYFAKNREIKEKYKELQQVWKVNKYYLAQVYWDVRYRLKDQWNTIKFPIMHHRFESDRMVVIKTEDDKWKWKGRYHNVETKILEHERNERENTTTIIISIHKWIRHQIRSHLSSIWYPIVWDPIYWKKKDQRRWELQLFCVGLGVKGE